MQGRYLEFESSYQALAALGREVGYRGRCFDDFALRPFLEDCLSECKFENDRPIALEYGTGTGPGACYLASQGFRVHGIDISETAIRLARQFAAQRELDVFFEVQDIVSYSAPDCHYDLVIDSFCLHRIIRDVDRATVLDNLFRMLKQRGHLIVGSVVRREERDYGADWLDESTGVVFSPLSGEATQASDAVRIDERWFYPKARHLWPGLIRDELKGAGFQVVATGHGGRFFCHKP